MIEEGLHVASGKRKFIYDLGGFHVEIHVEEEIVRVALGPYIRACGSEGGHGYGWWKRQHCFSLAPPTVFPDTLQSYLGSPSTNGAAEVPHTDPGVTANRVARAGGSEMGCGDAPGRTEHVEENFNEGRVPVQPPRIPIADYDAPSDIEGADGTQDSTARLTFPKVSVVLSNNMELALTGAESSGDEWLLEFIDTVESEESDFASDVFDESIPPAPSLEECCMRPVAFTPPNPVQLAQHYRRGTWNASTVDFVRSRDNFTGPQPGLKSLRPPRVPQPQRVFELYWFDACLDRIVEEMNMYTRGEWFAVGDAGRTLLGWKCADGWRFASSWNAKVSPASGSTRCARSHSCTGS